MDHMCYEEIVNTILGDNRITPYMPEGEAMSPLYITRDAGQKAHGFLVLNSIDGERYASELSITVPAPETKPVIRMAVLAEINFSVSSEEAWRQYTALYPDVFGFAFEVPLDRAQRQTLEQFWNAWVRSISQHVQIAFNEVFPEFVRWKNQVL